MSLLDVFSVKESQIHTEFVNGEAGIKEGWWSKYRDRRDLKMSIAIGAVPEKVRLRSRCAGLFILADHSDHSPVVLAGAGHLPRTAAPCPRQGCDAAGH